MVAMTEVFFLEAYQLELSVWMECYFWFFIIFFMVFVPKMKDIQLDNIPNNSHYLIVQPVGG